MAERELIGKLIMAAITFLLGAILIGVIAAETLTKTTQTVVTSEQVTIPRINGGGHVNTTYYLFLQKGCPGGSQWRTDAGSQCDIDILNVKNNSGTVLTETTDYVVDTSAVCTDTTHSTDGDLKFVDTVAVNQTSSNNTYVTYSYCNNDYLTSSFGRSSMNMIAGFIAIALLAAGAGYFFSIWRDSQD